MTEAKERLERAAHAVETAKLLIEMEEATIRQFLKECSDMENFGHILDPTLYRNPERRAVSAMLEPLFKNAIIFLDTHKACVAVASAALAAVDPKENARRGGR